MRQAVLEIDQDITAAAALGNARQRFSDRKPNLTEDPLKLLTLDFMMTRPDEGHAWIMQRYNNPMICELIKVFH